MLASIRQWIFGSHETVHEHHGNLRHVSLVDIGPPLSYGQALLSTKETALRTAWTTLQLSSRAGGLVPIVGPGISLGLDLVVQLCQVAKDHQLIKPTIEHARYLAISALIDTVASSQGQIDRHAVGSILQEADLNEALTFNNAVANNIKSIVQSLLDICEEFARRSPIAQAARFPDFRGNVKAKEDEIMFEWEKLSQQYLCRIDASAGEISAVMRRFERGLNELQATQRTTLQHIIENARENHSELMSEIATLRAETGHPGSPASQQVQAQERVDTWIQARESLEHSTFPSILNPLLDVWTVSTSPDRIIIDKQGLLQALDGEIAESSSVNELWMQICELSASSSMRGSMTETSSGSSRSWSSEAGSDSDSSGKELDPSYVL